MFVKKCIFVLVFILKVKFVLDEFYYHCLSVVLFGGPESFQVKYLLTEGRAPRESMQSRVKN